jgi:carbon-monoxide dehydrogenase medium subunit
VKPAPFAYHRAASVAEAVALLKQHGPETKILAGGQSLLPMMKLRLARPAALVDINRVRELAYVRPEDGGVAFGALARLEELESAAVRERCPILAQVARDIAHAAIRHRGTVCGSLAHADPAAELPVIALALEAELVATGPRGRRTIPARDFFVTYLTTALAEDEILSEARFPALRPATGWGFVELARRPGDFAIVSAAAVLDVAGGVIRTARLALGAVGDRAVRCPEAEAALAGQAGGRAAFEGAAALAAQPLDPPSDVHGSAAYRRHLARVLAARALTQAWQRVDAARGR